MLLTPLDESCACGATTPTPIDPCAPPTTLGLTIGDCGPIQTAMLSGQGTSAFVYTWSITGGIAVDFPGAVTGIITAVPSLRIQQTNPNIPMTVTVVVGGVTPCPTTVAIRFATLNVPQLTNDPGEVIPVGATNITFGDPTIFRYVLNGSWLASQNNVLSGSGCSYHGSVVTSGSTAAGSFFLDVRWNVKTAPYALASVYGTSRNVCSNQTKSGWLTPITIQ